MRLAVLACALLILGAGVTLVAGSAQACRVGVGEVCLVPGGSSCDPDGTCYPCDPRPGHPFDC